MTSGKSKSDITASVPFLGKTVELVLSPVGEDLLLRIAGADKPHIGAAALAQPYPKGDRLSACASVLCVYGHREAELAQAAARLLAKKYGVVVSCVCGVHFARIEPEQIPRLVEQILHAVERLSFD